MPSPREKYHQLSNHLRTLVGDDDEYDLLVDIYNAAKDCDAYAELALGEALTERGQEQSAWRAIGAQARYASRRILKRHLIHVFGISRLYRCAIHEVWKKRHGDSKLEIDRLIQIRDSLTRRHKKRVYQLTSVALATFARRSEGGTLDDLDPVGPDEMIFVDTNAVRESSIFQDLIHAAAFAASYGESLVASADGIDDVLDPEGHGEQLRWGQAVVARSNNLRCQRLPAVLAEIFSYKLCLSVVWAGEPYDIERFDIRWRDQFWPEYTRRGLADDAVSLDQLSTGLAELYELSTSGDE